MVVVGPVFSVWVICFLFGAFCVWKACEVTRDLGTAASKGAGGADGAALDLHIGKWFQIATQSPAVAFFALGVLAGVALPAFYAYLNSPNGPRGYKELTVSGAFNPKMSGVCLQRADEITTWPTGYAIKVPKDFTSMAYSIDPPDKSFTEANLRLEMRNDGLAWYSIDQAPFKPASVDSNGGVSINDAIPLNISSNSESLPLQAASGSQTSTMLQASQGQRK